MRTLRQNCEHEPSPLRRLRPILFALGLAILTPWAFAADPGQRVASPTAPETDEAAAFFGLHRLWTFSISVASDAWKAMEPVRPEGPPAGPGRMGRDYPEVPAQLEWEGRRWTNVSLRFKGNSSFNFARDSLKRSLKLDFNDLTKGQRFLGLTKLNLNNNSMDATQMQEALGYDLCQRAGVLAPRTAFVRVYLTVPGEHDQRYLGLYTAVEQVDERFLARTLGTDQGLLLKPETAPGLPYFGNTWSPYKAAYDPKSNASNPEKQRLMAFAQLVQEADDATFDREIGEFLEVDDFLRFLAVNVVLANFDSFLAIGHNYYLHLDPHSQRFRFLPWDLNHAFGKFPVVGSPIEQMESRFFPPHVSRNPLIQRLLASPTRADAYRREVRTLVENHFQPERLHAQVDAIASLIRPAIPGDQLYTPAEFERALGGTNSPSFSTQSLPRPDRQRPDPPGRRDRGPSLKDWVSGRASSLRAQLDGSTAGSTLTFQMGPRGDRGGPRGMNLAERVGPRLHRAADLDENHEVTRAELLQAIEKSMHSADSNNDGELDEAELREALLPLLPGPGPDPRGRPGQPIPQNAGRSRPDAPGPAHAISQRLLRTSDRDQSGGISPAEARQLAGEVMDRMDVNRNETLSLEEWMPWIESLLGPPPRPPQPEPR